MDLFGRALLAFLALPGVVAYVYVAVALVLLGWAAAFASVGLLLYALAVVAAFQLRVVLGEEPWLARTHGDAWAQYAARVRRWL